MFNATQFKEHIVEPTLRDLIELLPGVNKEQAVDLLMGTCWQESLGGTYLVQMGGGPALGAYQMEPATLSDIYDNYIEYNEGLEAQVYDYWPPHSPINMMISDLTYQTVMCRIHYYRQSFTWPEKKMVDHSWDTYITQLGEIWKKYYNTYKGKGKVSEFVHNFPREVL